MALTDNPFIGLTLDELTTRRALWLQALDDVAKAGKSHAFPGLSVTRADLPEIRETLSQLRVAIDYTSGKTHQVVQATIDTAHKFTGHGR